MYGWDRIDSGEWLPCYACQASSLFAVNLCFVVCSTLETRVYCVLFHKTLLLLPDFTCNHLNYTNSAKRTTTSAASIYNFYLGFAYILYTVVFFSWLGRTGSWYQTLLCILWCYMFVTPDHDASDSIPLCFLHQKMKRRGCWFSWWPEAPKLCLPQSFRWCRVIMYCCVYYA